MDLAVGVAKFIRIDRFLVTDLAMRANLLSPPRRDEGVTATDDAQRTFGIFGFDRLLERSYIRKCTQVEHHGIAFIGYRSDLHKDPYRRL